MCIIILIFENIAKIPMKNKRKAEQNGSLYKEFVRIHPFITIAIILIQLILITTIVTTSIYVSESIAFTIPFCSILLVLFVFIGINFRGIQISVFKDFIEVKFGILNKKIIPFREIIKCEMIKVLFKTYMGLGVRIGFDGSLAYTTDFKKAIRLTYNNDKMFVFSTNKSQELFELLSSLMKNVEN